MHFFVWGIVDSSTKKEAKDSIYALMGSFDANLDIEVDDFGNSFIQNGYWDYWVIGGRWDGMLLDKNIIPTTKLLDMDNATIEKCLAYSIVTPDGEWHNQNIMTQMEWKTYAINILIKYPDKYLIGIDCHI